VEITLKKMDKDHDNRLGDNDFSASVREDPLLLSCFGQVFANARVRIMHCVVGRTSQLFRSSLQIVEAFLHFFSEDTTVKSHRY
jgi:hypothetical protein